jgi:hypothetical protein
MNKFIGFMTGLTICFSSALRADEIGPRTEYLEAAETPSDQNMPSTGDQTPKSVGKAATDGVATAKGSGAGKYVLAAAAIGVGIAALILVHKNSGHHHHSHSH